MTTGQTTVSGAMPRKPSSPFAVFRRRNFSLMWMGQFVETVGCALTSLAASILVYRETGGSALSVALMLMASALPSLLIGLVAGVHWGETWALICGIIGFAAGLIFAKFINNLLARKSLFLPIITEIIDREG